MQDLARQLSVSGSTLSKSFRQETGRTVSEYLDSLLLRQACRMLLSTNLRIGEIAEKLQFCDPYYFSRYFKSRQQETPSHYRRRMSGSV